MAEAAKQPMEVMPKRKMGGPMMYPHQTNQPQLSPLARTLSAMVVVMQALSGHSLFRTLILFQHSYNFACHTIFLVVSTILYKCTFVIK